VQAIRAAAVIHIADANACQTLIGKDEIARVCIFRHFDAAAFKQPDGLVYPTADRQSFSSGGCLE